MYFLVFLFTTYLGYAEVEHDHGSWNSITLIKEISSNQDLSLEHEIRYSDKVGNLAQEQFKLLYRYAFESGQLGFGANLRLKGSYGPVSEKRLLVQWESVLLQSKQITYSSRVRYELRDFSNEGSFVRRFRWLNELEFNFEFLNGWIPLVSSEFNYYLNDTDVNNSGFYSHRTVATLSKSFGPYVFAFQYINDYKNELFNDSINNAFGLDLAYVF